MKNRNKLHNLRLNFKKFMLFLTVTTPLSYFVDWETDL